MAVDRRIIDLYNEYVHTALPRREFLTARYNEPAAKLAWSRTMDFFDTYLKNQ